MVSVLKDAKLSAAVHAANERISDWVVDEMPPGYQNRLAEIRRLTADLEEMGRFSSLLCDVGVALRDVVRELFVSLKFDVEPLPVALAVRLEGRRRLLLHVSEDELMVQKKSGEIAQLFQILHELAEEDDRVVFVTNTEPATRPAERGEAVAPDALAFLQRMGVIHVPAATLFVLWKLSLQEPERAREQVMRLFGHAGGTFTVSQAALV